MATKSKFSISNIKNSIMGHICLKLIENDNWESALNLYKSYPSLSLNVKNKNKRSLIEILIPHSVPEGDKDNEFKNELLIAIFSSFKGDKNDELFKYGVFSHYQFDNIQMSTGFIVFRVLSHMPHLAPNLFESLSQSPNKNAFLSHMLNFSADLNDKILMDLAIKYYTSEPSLPFPAKALTYYFNLGENKNAPVLSLDEFVDSFNGKKVDYNSFIAQQDFLFTQEHINENFIAVKTSELEKITQDIISFYKKLNSLGFEPTSSDMVETGPPINLLERCFLKTSYLSVLALAQVYPHLFCSPEKIEKLKSWLDKKSHEPHCVLHPNFSNRYVFPKHLAPKTFDFVKNGLQIVFQKIELENSIKELPNSNNIKPLKI